MGYLTIDSDSTVLIYDGDIPDDGKRPDRQATSTTVMITSNDDSATVQAGTKSSGGTFKAFPDGVILEGNVINHGVSTRLWLNISGITSNPVELWISR